MCDNCDGRVKHGVAALEALANGEEVPEPPEGLGVTAFSAKVREPTFELPFPVMAFETDNGNVGILTDQEGWAFFKRVLEMLGGVHKD